MSAAARRAARVGIEIGNARVKVVALTSRGPRALAYPVPVRGGPPRGTDVADGFASSVAAFEADTGIALAESAVAVACTHQFAYPTFRTALVETCALLRRLIPDARLAANEGLFEIDEAEALARSPEDALRFAASRVAGIRALGQRFGNVDVAVDCGSTSTEIVPVKLDPGYRPNESRLTDGRLVWIGLLETPLDYVAREAAGYPIVPRVARMAAVTGYLGLPGLPLPPLAGDRASLAGELAQAAGLDPEILLDDEIERIARALREGAIAHIAGAIARVLRECGARRRVTAGVLGIGKAALAIPALAGCAVRDVTDLEAAAGVPPNFGSAAGLALLAAGGRVDVAYAGESAPSPGLDRHLAGRGIGPS